MDREAGNKFNQWVHRAILGDEYRNRRVGKLKDTGARWDKGAPGPFLCWVFRDLQRGSKGRADRNTSARLQISRAKPLWLGSRCARSLATDSETLGCT